MPLLTPSESYAFQNFLTQIDYNDALELTYPASDWVYFNNPPDAPSPAHVNVAAGAGANGNARVNGQMQAYSPEIVKFAAEAHIEAIPQVDGDLERAQLARATKDLMSLDSNPVKWNDSADRDLPLPAKFAHPHPHDGRARSVTRSGSFSSFRLSPPSTTSSASFDSTSGATKPEPSAAGQISNGLTATRPAGLKSIPAKRQHEPDAHASSASPTSSVSTSTAIHPHPKRQRSSPHPIPPAPSSSSSSRQPLPGQSGPILSKPSLLSPSQKKANHIQSEQKRRANIRRGYEALCTTVPALREAIRAEEDAQRTASAADGGEGEAARRRRRGKRKGSGANTNGNGNGVDERTDGRAGPRSENIVLQKTIDYINELLSDRASLLSRLHYARSRLPSGHPAVLSPPSARVYGNGLFLWEREWTGALGIGDQDQDQDGDGEGDGDGDSDDSAG